MMWYRLGNFILYSALTAWSWYRFLVDNHVLFLIPAVGAPLMFFYIYIPIFRRKGFSAITEIWRR